MASGWWLGYLCVLITVDLRRSLSVIGFNSLIGVSNNKVFREENDIG